MCRSGSTKVGVRAFVSSAPAALDISYSCSGMLLKYRAEKLFKTWQPRICTIEGLALVYKGKADGKVRGVVSLKDCVLKPGPAEFEGSIVIKSGTPYPSELKDKKNRSFQQGREYVRARGAKATALCFRRSFVLQIFKPDPKDASCLSQGVVGVRDAWFKQIIIAQIVIPPFFLCSSIDVHFLTRQLSGKHRLSLDPAQTVQPAQQRC